MATTKNRRWSCPEGAHAGVLAPSRLRKVDVRRYCLPCSTKTGVLVERSCAANERNAERSRQRSSQKATSRRRRGSAQRESAAAAQRDREIIAGVDVAREYDRVWAHAVKLTPVLRATAPPLTVSRSPHGGDDYASGHAYTRHSTHLTVGHECDAVRLCGVIVHEIGHHVAAGHDHTDVFWSLLAELVEVAYPGTEVGVLSGHHYKKQVAIEQAMYSGCSFLSAEPFKSPRKPAVPRQKRTKIESVVAAGRRRRSRNGHMGLTL